MSHLPALNLLDNPLPRIETLSDPNASWRLPRPQTMEAEAGDLGKVLLARPEGVPRVSTIEYLDPQALLLAERALQPDSQLSHTER